MGNFGRRDSELRREILGGELGLVLNRELEEQRDVLSLHVGVIVLDFQFGNRQ